MKIRANSILTKLSDEQLEQIFGWIASGVTYAEVQKRCALPAPDGFDLHIHINTLWRFFTSERRRRHSEELAQSKFDDLATDDRDQLLQNVRIELAHACYDLAHNADASSVNTLARITHRLDVIQLEQQRIAVEREYLAEKIRQFNFNAAKQAAIYALQIKEVLKDKTLDVEQKVWKVNNIIFAASTNPPSQTMAPSAPDQPTTHSAANQPQPTERAHRAPSPPAGEGRGEGAADPAATTHPAENELPPTHRPLRAPSPRGEGRGEGLTHAQDDPPSK